MKHLAILGAGGHGRVVAESAVATGWHVSFFDDFQTGKIDDHHVVGSSADLVEKASQYDGVFVAIGANWARLDWIGRLRLAGGVIETIIDPSSRISASATVELGCFLASGSIVVRGTRLGAGCIVNTAASIDHDCHLADGVHLSPGVHLSGNVRIGEASWLGTGCSVRNNIVIGSDVIAGVGCAIVGDVASGQTVVGVPAKPLERS